MKYPLHVGYRLSDPESVKQFISYDIDETLLDSFNSDAYTAIKYHKTTSNEELVTWYNKRKTRKFSGFISKLHISDKYVVAELTIDGVPTYLTIVSRTNMPPIDIKKCVNRGDFYNVEYNPRKEIVLEPYIHYGKMNDAVLNRKRLF